MTEEQIKEAISHHFVQLIASRRGFKCGRPEPDHGCDLNVRRATPMIRNGNTRWLDTGEAVDLQLKCTTEHNVQRQNGAVLYDLEAKSYNDLIDRRSSGGLIPLILILLVLPDDQAQWVTVTADELVVRRAAYWFLPPVGAPATQNVATIRISIPTAQTVGLPFLEERFQEAFP